ncbi:class I SAM-dependent methyltransferase [Leptolyngbya sp. Heron Island J]|uniref:class I SAM-dependent methyltransferase n=1 Tax=Leptolyngbya sp. Heron Island J TaxID=1385935 RepID=UPI000560ABCD|nr:methyltransferase domain-containing protein [Leptolyngbya sp. Heron Island J]
MLNSTERFSNRVTDYVKYRPDYPSSLMAYLTECCRLRSNQIVADIGSGTGLLTQLFLKQGNPVYGVEPNANMRAAAEEFLQMHPHFQSVVGQAEATQLGPNSVDWIVAGQAFHWFNQQAAHQEFNRILKPDGWIALIWNSRLMSDPFQQAYEEFLLTHAPDYSVVSQRRPSAETLAEFFAPAKMQTATFAHQQVFDFEGLQGRLLSCSYAPTKEAENYGEMMEALRSLFNQYSHQNQLFFRYTTYVYYAQPKGARQN